MLKSPALSTSFLESRMIQKLKSRKSRIKPGLFAFLLAERIIFGKKTQKRETSACLSLFFRSDWGRSLGTRSVSGIAAEAPPVADAARRGWRSGRRLARRPRRRRQSRAPQEGLRSKFKSVPPFSPCYGGVPPFFKSILGFLTRLHPSPTAAPPSSTQNAPSFAFFGLFRVRFAVFVLF